MTGASVVGDFVGLIVGLIVGLVVGRDVPGTAVAGASVPGDFVGFFEGFFEGFFVGLAVGRDVTGFVVVGLLVGLSDTVGGLVFDGRIFTSAQFQNSTVAEEYESTCHSSNWVTTRKRINFDTHVLGMWYHVNHRWDKARRTPYECNSKHTETFRTTNEATSKEQLFA